MTDARHLACIDHIGLAVPDIDAGIAEVTRRTGAKPTMVPQEPGQWYRSAFLPLGGDAFLEIIAPNPAHRSFHPLKTIIRRLKEPRILFWYVNAEDIAQAERAVRKAGFRLARKETVGESGRSVGTHYTRAVIGPGFETQRPCVIQWHRRANRNAIDLSCLLHDFELMMPAPDRDNALLEELGIGLRVRPGLPEVRLALSTPNGLVAFQSVPYRYSFWRLAGAVASDIMDTIAWHGAIAEAANGPTIGQLQVGYSLTR